MGRSIPDHLGNKDEALVRCAHTDTYTYTQTHILVLYLLQDGVDPVHFAVDEEAFLLPAIHLLDDAPVFYGVHDVPHRASRHLPVVGYRWLHDGLEDGKPWRSRRRKATSDILLQVNIENCPRCKAWHGTATKKSWIHVFPCVLKIAMKGI